MNLKADAVQYLAAAIAFANSLCCQSLHVCFNPIQQ
jgi:hypothetical protein